MTIIHAKCGEKEAGLVCLLLLVVIPTIVKFSRSLPGSRLNKHARLTSGADKGISVGAEDMAGLQFSLERPPCQL